MTLLSITGIVATNREHAYHAIMVRRKRNTACAAPRRHRNCSPDAHYSKLNGLANVVGFALVAAAFYPERSEGQAGGQFRENTECS